MISQTGNSNGLMKRIASESNGSAVGSSDKDAASQFKDIFDNIFSSAATSMFPVSTPLGPKRIENEEIAPEAPLPAPEPELLAEPVIEPVIEVAPTPTPTPEQAAVASAAVAAPVVTETVKPIEQQQSTAPQEPTSTEKNILSDQQAQQGSNHKLLSADLKPAIVEQQDPQAEMSSLPQQSDNAKIAEQKLSNPSVATKMQQSQQTVQTEQHQQQAVDVSTPAGAASATNMEQAAPSAPTLSAQKTEKVQVAAVAVSIDEAESDAPVQTGREHAPASKPSQLGVQTQVAVKAASERAGSATSSALGSDRLRAVSSVADQPSIRIEKPQMVSHGVNLLNSQEKRNLMKEAAQTGRGPNQARTMEQIQKALDSATRSKDGNTIVLKLDPIDLGEVSVKVTKRGDQIFARVNAENSEVEKLVRGQVQEIVHALQSAGFKPENVHVSFGAERPETEWPAARQWNSQGNGQESARGGKQGGGTNAHDLPGENPASVRQSSAVDAGWVA